MRDIQIWRAVFGDDLPALVRADADGEALSPAAYAADCVDGAMERTAQITDRAAAIAALSRMLESGVCRRVVVCVGGADWPESGEVVAPARTHWSVPGDWVDPPECEGVIGLDFADSSESLRDEMVGSDDSRWLVVAAEAPIQPTAEWVQFTRGTVLHCGTRATAEAYAAELIRRR